MPTPTARLLDLLELLQSQTLVTGEEIAGRLGVDRRTVRRYVDALQSLGIPVEGQRGVGGGYRLRPGYRLPPLMLSDDEAVAVVLGLVAAERLGLETGDHAASALGKIHRVLPSPLRRRVEALESTLAFTGAATAGIPVAGETLLAVAEAARRRRRVRARYTSFDGRRSRRELSPHGLVVHSGRWYLAAHDHGRDALRTFRVDRIGGVELLDAAADAPPAAFDAVTHVARSLATVTWEHDVEVVLALDLETAAQRIPATLAELVADGDRTVLRLRASSLDWAAGVLAGLGCELTIVRPDELRGSLLALAARLTAAAESAR